MMEVKITVWDDATPAVQRVRAFLGSEQATRLAGYEGQRVVREHLGQLDMTRANRLGGRRTHYYGAARQATSYHLEGNAAIVEIRQIGIRLHYYGGTVSAGVNASTVTGVATKYLTIPVAPEAHGKRASDFDLVLMWGRNGPYGLALAERTDRMTRHGYTSTVRPGKMMFTLRKQVDFAPDPDVLPSAEKLGMAVGDRLATYIARVWNVGAAVTAGEPSE